MTRNRVYNMLGIAARAGAVSSGAFAAESTIKSGKALIAILAADAADNARDRYRDMCHGYGVVLYEYGTKEELGHAIGKDERAVLTITDESLAGAVEKLLKDEKAGEE